MKKFKIIEKLEKYKYEFIFVVGLIGTALINENDPFSSLSGLSMLFGAVGMLLKTLSPTVNVVTVDVEHIIKMIENISKTINKIPDSERLNELRESLYEHPEKNEPS